MPAALVTMQRQTRDIAQYCANKIYLLHSYFSCPLKMYGELPCDMGPYRMDMIPYRRAPVNMMFTCSERMFTCTKNVFACSTGAPV